MCLEAEEENEYAVEEFWNGEDVGMQPTVEEVAERHQKIGGQCTAYPDISDINLFKWIFGMKKGGNNMRVFIK